MARLKSFSRQGFEPLEDRKLMAVDLGASNFSPALMGDAIEELSTGNAVGFGYAINLNGDANAAVGSGGQARLAIDAPARSFSSLVELEVSSVSKPITATAILHFLQSMPGGLDAALKTKLVDYLPGDWDPGSNVQHISLRHLLTHTSGLSETNNAIGVNFENYGNNTYANIQNLIETGLTAPNVAADNVFDGPRWDLNDASGNYNNVNFTLLARVVLPKLITPAINLTAAAFPGARDAVSGLIYSNYVQNEIFEPMGIDGADLSGNDANPAKGYDLGSNAAGGSMSNLTSLGGAFGWKLSARELATFLDGIQRDGSILWASTRNMRDAQELGWFNSEDAFGDYYSHNGATTSGGGKFRSLISVFPGGIEASYLMNSDDDDLPGGSISAVLKKSYVNGWTDLTVAGTSGVDTFQATTVMDSGKEAIRVTLNGEVQFTRWIDGLDSITLNGSLGNDTFTISDWNSSVELIINGQGDNDSVGLLSGLRNIELVSGMTFNGGSGQDTLLAYDQNNPYSMPGLSQLYTVSDEAIVRHRGLFIQNAGLVPIPVVVNYALVENLELTTGGLADIVNVASMTSGDTEIRTGAGNDVVRVGQTAANLQLVDGLFIDGQTGTDSIELFDSNKVIGDDFFGQYDVEATSVTRYVTGGFVINPNPPKYTVDFAGMENLALTTTDGADRIRVHGTTSGEVIIHGGAGSDILTTTPSTQNMERVRDLSFFGEAGVDGIVINDQQNPYSHKTLSREYDVSASQVARTMAGRVTPLAVDVSYNSVENLTLNTGDQGDHIDVANTTSGEVVIHAGPGNDFVNASTTSQNMESVNDLIVDGGAGNDTLNILDANNPYDLGPGGGVYAVTTDAVSRFDEHILFENVAVPVDVQFSAVETVDLDAGNQGDVFNVTGTGGPANLTLDGNAGADQFNIKSPAFGTINVQGDAPILAPGDKLVVNEAGAYATAPIPGIYVIGSGGVTLGPSSIHYSGIETTDIHSQVTLLGDTDGDGDVDVTDLNNVRNNFGGGGLGDTDGDGDVDIADLNNVRNNFGDSLPSPSPASESMLADESESDWQDALVDAQFASTPLSSPSSARRLKAVDELFALI
ncbi:MAG: serine hydrolase [Planctomycetia bacterium]|nr:serine hydrolase [Planctomycetia bacterium]